MRKHYSLLIVVVSVALFAVPAFCLIDINTASQSELESLPGIGPVYAGRIIEGRPYRSISDIMRVKGIGNKTFAKFKGQITCGSAKKEKKKSPAAAAPPKEVPVYSTESFQTIKCWHCKNMSHVSSGLKSGWCPYCNAKWAAKERSEISEAPAVQPINAVD